MKALRVERGQEHLQVRQVFELEVTNGGLAFGELLDELSEAVADPLPSQQVILLEAPSHASWQERFVAKSGELVRWK